MGRRSKEEGKLIIASLGKRRTVSSNARDSSNVLKSKQDLENNKLNFNND